MIGAIGSIAMALAGPRLVATPGAGWWFELRIPPGRAGNMLAFYAGMAALSIAWLGLGRRLTRRTGTHRAVRQLRLVAALWALPLLAGPPLFSSDMYSYLAQGTILAHGLDPYQVAPTALAHLGAGHVLGAVSPFWRATTAPYGPLFLGLVRVIVAFTGQNLVAGILLVRLVEVAGIVVLAAYLPRLARALGADGSVATWLGVCSPLVLLELIAAGHNDALMAGLLAAGVTIALEGRPIAGIFVCAVAATVKVPAAAAVVLLTVAHLRAERDVAGKVRRAAGALLVTAAAWSAVGAATGLGLRWISSTVLSTPGKVHLAITPVTAAAYTVARVLQASGVSVSWRHLETVFGDIALAATALFAVVIALRARWANLAPSLGMLLAVAVVGGPAAWPWYLSWSLAVLAACPGPQRSIMLALGLAVAAFLVKPDGILAIPLQAAPAVVGVVLAAIATGVLVRRTGLPRRDEAPAAAGGEP